MKVSRWARISQRLALVLEGHLAQGDAIEPQQIRFGQHDYACGPADAVLTKQQQRIVGDRVRVVPMMGGEQWRTPIVLTSLLSIV